MLLFIMAYNLSQFYAEFFIFTFSQSKSNIYNSYRGRFVIRSNHRSLKHKHMILLKSSMTRVSVQAT